LQSQAPFVIVPNFVMFDAACATDPSPFQAYRSAQVRNESPDASWKLEAITVPENVAPPVTFSVPPVTMFDVLTVAAVTLAPAIEPVA
jgi:hypothetical protein